MSALQTLTEWPDDIKEFILAPDVELKQRRQKLQAKLDQHKRAVMLVVTHPEQLASTDQNFNFRPHSDVLYLLGVNEPESFLVMTSKDLGGKSYAFIRPRDEHNEIWHGLRLGVERARKFLGLDDVFSSAEFKNKLPELLVGAENIFYELALDADRDQWLLGQLQHINKSQARLKKRLFPVIHPIQSLTWSLRLHKSAWEVAQIKRAAQATKKAHEWALHNVKPGMSEQQVHAQFEQIFLEHAHGPAYHSIIAGGERCCILHYHNNNRVLNNGDLLLIDAAAHYNYYASDVTRTFRVGTGDTSNSARLNAQRDIYQLVLDVQKKAVQLVKPGISLADIHLKVQTMLIEGLKQLILLDAQASVDHLINDAQGLKRFYPHNTGHYLGLDVHDVGEYSTEVKGEIVGKPLEPGMVITIEPGIYCQPFDLQCPEIYRGIGVRIEDDVLVTDTGYENLTGDIIKTSL